MTPRPHAYSLGDADQGAQALDLELALVIGHVVLADGIHERLLLLAAWTPLADLAAHTAICDALPAQAGQSPTISRIKVII